MNVAGLVDDVARHRLPQVTRNRLPAMNVAGLVDDVRTSCRSSVSVTPDARR